MKRRLLFILALILAVMTVACGGEDAPTPTADAVAESVRQTVAAIAVAQTVAALNENGAPAATPPVATAEATAIATPVATLEATPTIALPGETVAPPTATQTLPSPTTAAEPVCTVLNGVNLRGGPGLVYEPPVGFAGAGTTLRPIAYTPFGVPQGAWIQAQEIATGRTVWVTAGAQFISCTIDLATLPRPAAVPPLPPTATPAPTLAPPVAALPPDLRNISGGAGCLDDPDIASDFQTDSRFLLRIYAQLVNPPPDELGDGAGIDRVEFSVRESGYTHTERTAGYCIFQGGEPTCRDWPRNSLGQLTWGNGGPVVVDGNYNIDVAVIPKEETFISQCNWTISLTIDVP